MSRGLKISWPGNVGPISSHTASRLAELGIACDDVARMPIPCAEGDLVNADYTVANRVEDPEACGEEILALPAPA